MAVPNLYGKVVQIDRDLVAQAALIASMKSDHGDETKLLHKILDKQVEQSQQLAEIIQMLTPAEPVTLRIDLTSGEN